MVVNSVSNVMSVIEVTVGNSSTFNSDTQDAKRQEEALINQIEISNSSEQRTQYAVYSARAEAILLEDLARETESTDSQQNQKQRVSLLPGLDIIA